MWDLTLSREVGPVNATDKTTTRRPKSGKTFPLSAAVARIGVDNRDGAHIAVRCHMTIIPRDSDIVAVVVLLGAVLITGLLRAFSF